MTDKFIGTQIYPIWTVYVSERHKVKKINCKNLPYFIRF